MVHVIHAYGLRTSTGMFRTACGVSHADRRPVADRFEQVTCSKCLKVLSKANRQSAYLETV